MRKPVSMDTLSMQYSINHSCMLETRNYQGSAIRSLTKQVDKRVDMWAKKNYRTLWTKMNMEHGIWNMGYTPKKKKNN